MEIRQLDLSDDGFKVAFLEGKLSIDCLEIKLTQKGTDKPRVYSAPGFLLLSPQNGAEGRLVVQRGEDNPYAPLQRLIESSKMAAGELIPETFYYRLEAKDVTCNVWTCDSLSIKVDSRQNAEIITFQCAYIETEIPGETKSDFVNFVFTDDLKLPRNRARSSSSLVRGQERHLIRSEAFSGEVAGMQVHYHQCDLDLEGEAFEFIAIAREGERMPAWVDLRLLEALRFCTATRAMPVMSEVSRAGKRVIQLSKGYPLKGGGLVQRPLMDLGASMDVFRLMESYFNFARTNAKQDVATPLSVRLENLYTLKDVWLNSVVLLVCVTAEGIVEDPLFKPLGAPQADELKAIDKIFESVGTADVKPILIERAQSTMGSMKSSRAIDRMFALASIGALTEAEVKAWKALRNTAAHGGVEIKDGKLQQCIDRVHLVVTMIYKLAFLKIGYVGKYSDFGVNKWPTADYDAPALVAKLAGMPQAARLPNGLAARPAKASRRMWRLLARVRRWPKRTA
jgi:hypothetical protein